MSDMSSAATASRRVGTWALGVAAAIALLAWAPATRGESLLWTLALLALVAGVLALTTVPRVLQRHGGPIGRALAEIRAERRMSVDDNDIEETQ